MTIHCLVCDTESQLTRYPDGTTFCETHDPLAAVKIVLVHADSQIRRFWESCDDGSPDESNARNVLLLLGEALRFHAQLAAMVDAAGNLSDYGRKTQPQETLTKQDYGRLVGDGLRVAAEEGKPC